MNSRFKRWQGNARDVLQAVSHQLQRKDWDGFIFQQQRWHQREDVRSQQCMQTPGNCRICACDTTDLWMKVRALALQRKPMAMIGAENVHGHCKFSLGLEEQLRCPQKKILTRLINSGVSVICKAQYFIEL